MALCSEPRPPTTLGTDLLLLHIYHLQMSPPIDPSFDKGWPMVVPRLCSRAGARGVEYMRDPLHMLIMLGLRLVGAELVGCAKMPIF